ncbi:MAG: response regulator [Burkholderiales bacterium]|nr:response regulator [Burkholderiales bacterium]
MRALRVLVVDDHLATVELTSFVLVAAGFVVESTTDATNALFLISNFGPDLILMDIQMPGIDGLELTRQLKAEPSMRHIVVVAFTAFAMKGDEARMRAAGCDGYIAKPFDVTSFAATVRSYIAARSGAQTQAR